MASAETWLRQLGACGDALPSVAGLSFQEAWAQCERGDWLLWVFAYVAGTPGWPTVAQVDGVLSRFVQEPTQHFLRAFRFLGPGRGRAYVAAAIADAAAPIGPDREVILQKIADEVRAELRPYAA
jgi:hypothetical protein